MVILENISLEFFDFLSTERAAMVATNCLLDANFAKDVTTTSNVGVTDGIEANCALEFILESINADFNRRWNLGTQLMLRLWFGDHSGIIIFGCMVIFINKAGLILP